MLTLVISRSIFSMLLKQPPACYRPCRSRNVLGALVDCCWRRMQRPAQSRLHHTTCHAYTKLWYQYFELLCKASVKSVRILHGLMHTGSAVTPASTVSLLQKATSSSAASLFSSGLQDSRACMSWLETADGNSHPSVKANSEQLHYSRDAAEIRRSCVGNFADI